MANNTYDAGPQLPNYMRKRMEAGTSASSARVKTAAHTASAGAAQKKTGAPASGARSGAAQQGGRQAASQGARQAKAPAQAKAQPQPKAQPRQNRSVATAGTQQKRSAAEARTQSKPTAAAAKKTQGGGNGRSSSRSRKSSRQQSKNTLRALLIAAALLACVIVLVWALNPGDPSNIPTDIEAILNTKKTFREGVKLIGVDVSGMTPEEATGLVKYAAEKKLEAVAVKVMLEDASWTFSADDLGMSYDLADMFTAGLAFGRSEDSEVQDVFAEGAGEFDAKYTWDRQAILAALAQLAPDISKEATQPYAEPILDWASTERFNYIAGEEGRALNAEVTADYIEAALEAGDFTATIEPMVNAVLPTLTIDDVKAHTQYISEYTTTFSVPRDDEVKQNRLFNIQKTADIINGNVIQPGEQWSFNTVVGPRTYELGWKGANGISGGKEYTVQAGGGICQPSTTLFNALVGANVEIVDRRKHSIPSDYVAVGLDATVDTSGIDFVFRNNTEYPLYIFAEVKLVEGRSTRWMITVYIYGEPLPEGVTYKTRSEIIEVVPRGEETVYTQDPSIPMGYQKEAIVQREGYVAEAYQDKYVDGELVESVLLHTDNYKGNPAEILIGTGPALQAGEPVPEGLVPYGTPPTPADSRA